jgi:glyoxylase-like metal-dependent hydrolase (beta-lactamase superfamily II)
MIKPLYHYLDEVWQRLPYPDEPFFEVEERGPLTVIRSGRCYGGRRPILVAHCYILGDTLIDTGIRAVWPQLKEVVRHKGVRQALVTHHHEDHSGNAANLLAEGIPVYAGEKTCEIMRHPMPLPFYQHLAWGKADTCELLSLEDDHEVGGYSLHALEAPGHAVDQLVFHVPEVGILFSADAFIHRRVRVFRRDEDFHEMLKTSRKLANLDYDRLLCGHRPQWEYGRQAMAEKVDWLETLHEQVLTWRRRGWSVAQMEAHFNDQNGSTGFDVLSAGDVSFANLVRSILYGAKPRLEMRPFQ